MTDDCLTEAECQALLAGDLEDSALARAEEHLETCGDCQQLLDRCIVPAVAPELLADTKKRAWDQLFTSGSDSALAKRLRLGASPGSDSSRKSGSESKLSDPSNNSATPSGLPGKPIGLDHVPDSDLNDFEILDEIGRGGMGVVYAARHKTLERRVAIKMLLTGPHAGMRELTRFDHEARAAARLHHPGIVELHGVGEHDGCPFLVMEYVDGNSLRREIKHGEITPRQAAEFTEAIAIAIHHAHCEGVIHRDVKPANILLERVKAKRDPISTLSQANTDPEPIDVDRKDDTDVRVPKVVDFGLATSFDPLTGELGTQFTRTGQFLGTPDYMAPELLDVEQSTGPEVDVYSLGATLYAMLTGQSPHQAASPVEVLEQIRSGAVTRPSQLKPGIPQDLETICLKCLEKSPESRYGSAMMLAEDLRRYLDGRPVLARRTPAHERFVRWCKRNPVVSSLTLLSAVLLIAVAVVSMVGWKQTSDALSEAAVARGNANIAKEKAVAAREKADAAKARAEASEAETTNTLNKLKILSDAQRRELVNYTVKRGFEELDKYGLEVGAMWFLRAMQLDDDDPDRQRVHRLRLGGLLQRRVRMTPVSVMRDIELYHPGHFIPHRNLLVIPKVYAPNTLALLYVDTKSGARERVDYPLGTRDLHQWSIVSPNNQFHVLIKTGGANMPMVDLETRKLHAGLESGGPIAAKSSVAFSANGQFLAILREDGMVRIWNVQNMSQHRELKTSDVSTPTLNPAVAIANEGRHIVVVSDHIRVWDATTGRLISEDPVSQRLARAELTSRDTVLVASGNSGTVIWNVSERKVLRHVAGAHRFALDAGRLRAAVYGQSGAVQVFHLQKGQPARGGIMQHDGAVTDVWFDNRLAGDRAKPPPASPPVSYPERRVIFDTLYTAEEGRTLRRWNVWSGIETAPAVRHPGTIKSIGRSDGRLFTLSGSIVYSLMAWDMPPQTSFETEHDIPLDVSRDQSRLAYRDAFRQQIAIYDTSTGRVIGKPIPYRNGVRGAYKGSLSPDGRQLIVNWRHPKPLEAFDVETGGSLGELKLPASAFRAADLSSSPDAILMSVDRTTWIVNRNGLDVRHEVTRRQLEHSVTIVRTLGSPDGSLVLSLNSARDVYDLIDTESGEFVGVKFFQEKQALTECWSPDSQRVAIGLNLGEARIWTPGKDVPDVVMRHGHDVVKVQFSDDGRFLATASKDHTARIWDAITGQPIGPMMQHDQEVTEVRLSPNNRLALTIDKQLTLNVWDVRSGHKILPPVPNPDTTHLLVRFSDSSDSLLLSSARGPVRHMPLKPLPADTDLAELLRRLEVQSTLRLQDDGSLIVLPISELQSRADTSDLKPDPVVERE